MNKLSPSDRVRVVACLVEGNSLRATVRMTGVHRTTVMKLLANLGKACSEYQDRAFRNLTCKRIQCDEIWSFVGCKEKNVPANERHQGRGDVWTWTAIDAETKLVPAWYVGNRDAGAAYHFMHDLAGRLANRVQLTTDAHRPYQLRFKGWLAAAESQHHLTPVHLIPIFGGLALDLAIFIYVWRLSALKILR
jgi:IS1 family transposase